MPSMVLGAPPASGPQLVISGNPWSGYQTPALPYQGINFFWSVSGAMGSGMGVAAYIALSGIQTALSGTASGNIGISGNAMAVNSGGMVLSGGCASGMLDGMPILPGHSYFVPRGALQRNLFAASGALSGNVNVFATCDTGASGIGRLYWEMDTRYGW